MLYVTSPYMPDKNKYLKYVNSIYDNCYLTNNGPLVTELEERLKDYLGVGNVVLVSNGTLALQIAYRLLDLNKSIITTPFSFVATTSSIVWEGANPVYADIDRRSFNLSVSNAEEKITDETDGIVPVHVFGNPCDVEKVDELSKKHGLKVVYDAAHSFGVKYKGKSILNYGDISTLSFHATKLFHTIEGGALIMSDSLLADRARAMINFGYQNGEIQGLGINAKMNEMQAAMGLCVLDEIDIILQQREEIWTRYKRELSDCFELQQWNADATNNYHYFPILFEDESSLLNAGILLKEKDVIARRYFHPSLNNLPYAGCDEKMTVSEDVAARVLCLPIFPGMKKESQHTIINTLKSCI